MTNKRPAFVIDDARGTAENLAAYVQVLGTIDGALGAALGLQIAPLAAGQPLDTATTWDALYAAMMSADADPTPTRGEDGAV